MRGRRRRPLLQGPAVALVLLSTAAAATWYSRKSRLFDHNTCLNTTSRVKMRRLNSRLNRGSWQVLTGRLLTSLSFRVRRCTAHGHHGNQYITAYQRSQMAAEQGQQKRGWERAVAKFADCFTQQGLTAADLPAAIGIYEVRRCTLPRTAAATWPPPSPRLQPPPGRRRRRRRTASLPHCTAHAASAFFTTLYASPLFSMSSSPLMQVVGLVMAAGFWSLCYAVQPSQTVARPLVQAAAKSQRAAAMHAGRSGCVRAARHQVVLLRCASSICHSPCLRLAAILQ